MLPGHRRHRADGTGFRSSPTCRSIFISGYGTRTRPSRGRWRRARPTTSSKPFLADRAEGADRSRPAPAGPIPSPFLLGDLEIRYEERRVIVGRPRRASDGKPSSSCCARSRSTPGGSRPTRPCCARSGAGATTAIPSWCAPTSRSSAASSADDAARPRLHRQPARGRLPHGPAGRFAGARRDGPMRDTAVIVVLLALLASSHMLLSGRTIRARLVARLGERRFLVAYSIVALTFFAAALLPLLHATAISGRSCGPCRTPVPLKFSSGSRTRPGS